ncbi:hypothetical protein IMSHALPRED_009759 [Imshaugia aleurites]|uniref:Uncharacterized protein n=1 Tax=Imshaugia aleurites TaxID=172621 RepID=A0A8H3INK6_9LECA|nr:hypothetical protein IMSHALPRED_009759 [Imshaugia aleurites]
MMQVHQLVTLLPLLAAPLSVLAIPNGACDGHSDGLSITWSGNVENVYYTFNGGANTGLATGCTELGPSFEGQVGISYKGVNGQIHANGTIFETNPAGWFDISYNLGYTLPVLCSSGSNGNSTGCAIDLFSPGNPPCPGGVQDGVCYNPTGQVGGPKDPGSYPGSPGAWPWCNACSAPDPFFAPCAGSAYTYPYDDKAMATPAVGSIQCCVGTACGNTGREGVGKYGYPQPSRSYEPCTLCASGSRRSRLERRWSHRHHHQK